MDNNDLDRLYEATVEDMLFAIGILLTESGPAPYIHIFYRDWTREQLEVVRQSFKSGLTLVMGERKHGTRDLYLASREKVALQAEDNGHTSVLRAPSWDARLADIDEAVVCAFETNRRRHGGFLLLVQTPEWEFLSSVSNVDGRTSVGAVLTQSLPVPQAHID